MTDAISRCDLFNALATVQAEDANEMKGKIYSVIQEMPTAKRPRATWMDTGSDVSHSHPLTAMWYRCSDCGYKPTNNQKTNYCPQCGAQMKGTDDD